MFDKNNLKSNKLLKLPSTLQNIYKNVSQSNKSLDSFLQYSNGQQQNQTQLLNQLYQQNCSEKIDKVKDKIKSEQFAISQQQLNNCQQVNREQKKIIGINSEDNNNNTNKIFDPFYKQQLLLKEMLTKQKKKLQKNVSKKIMWTDDDYHGNSSNNNIKKGGGGSDDDDDATNNGGSILQQQQKKGNNNNNQKRKNPFIKEHESDKFGRKYFEYIEPEVINTEKNVSGLQQSFIYMIIGPPKSGKTRLLVELLNNPNLYGSADGQKNFYQKVIFVSPSILPGFKLSTGYNYLKNFDLFLLRNMMERMDEEYQQSEEFKQTNKKGHLILVLDDCVGQIFMLNKNRDFQNICNNRRQLLISLDIEIITTSQTAIGLPTTIRKIATGLFVFQVLSGNEFKTLQEENVPKRYKDSFKSIVNEYLKDRFDFIYISRYPFEVFAGGAKQNKNIPLQRIVIY